MTDLTRRGFIQGSGSAVAAVAGFSVLDLRLPDVTKPFNFDQKLGWIISFDNYGCKPCKLDYLDIIEDSANQFLPEGVRYEVLFSPRRLGWNELDMLCWKSSPRVYANQADWEDGLMQNYEVQPGAKLLLGRGTSTGKGYAA